MEREHVVNEIHRKICRLKKLNLPMFFEGLSEGEFMMLIHLESLPREKGPGNQEVSVSDLKNTCKVSMPAVSRMLHTMEKKRLVECYRSIKDKRTTYVRLTNEGRQILKEAKEGLRVFLDAITARLGVEKTRMLGMLFEEFYDILESELKKRLSAVDKKYCK